MFMAMGCSKGPQEAPPAPAVEVMTVIQKDVPVYHEWIGTLDGMVNATIRAQVQGYLIKQNYREGDFVKTGQVLFEIDPRTFQAALDQAKGQLEAQQARWTTAKANLARIKPLADLNAVSKKDLDDSIGTEQSARAAVLSAQATVDKAQLDLGFTRIISPVDGICGPCQGADRKPRRSGGRGRTDDGLDGQPDQGLHPGQRTGIPPGRP